MNLKKISLIIFSILISTGCTATPKGDQAKLPTVNSGAVTTQSPQAMVPTNNNVNHSRPIQPVIKSDRPNTQLANRADVAQFIERVGNRHNLDKKWLTDIFNHTSLKPSIVSAMNRPAEGVKIWGEYRPIFITEKRINDGVTFYHQYQTALERAEREYGVNAEIIAAIIGVETSYGQNRGNWAVIDALSTLAFDYPRRAEFFAKELENFLTIVDETRFDPFSYKGSYAGAMGYPQFMPSSYLGYAVDFDGDGVRDLWNNPVDAIGSVANYLAKHNWQRNAPIVEKVDIQSNNPNYEAYIHSGRLTPPKHNVSQLRNAGVIIQDQSNRKATLYRYQNRREPAAYELWIGYDNFYSITRYNHSQMYALAVYQLSDAIRSRL